MIDQFITKFDHFLRTLTGHQITEPARPLPSEGLINPTLTTNEQRHVAGLMRINYAGEICAQALYQGQALTTRNMALKQHFNHAALEEQDHLLWCQARLQQLGSRPSLLNPVWYLGSLALGTFAGLAGDRWSLGFLAETEQQVTLHLSKHLQKLPRADEQTRVILQQMKTDEQQHANDAYTYGAATLPIPIKYAMRFTSKIMTTIAYWV